MNVPLNYQFEFIENHTRDRFNHISMSIVKKIFTADESMLHNFLNITLKQSEIPVDCNGNSI